ncbi:hypothetical protein [Cereibacter azotoformans]|uniref:hypothetical protein n=1 Tax=Cereibacter azotoformans TaxID=43057 RepID=UPI00117B466C|nr:hypothetical protein [Cereibacter azotoformans]
MVAAYRIPNDRLYAYPGIFSPGSDADQQLTDLANNVVGQRGFGLRVSGELIDFGIVEGTWADEARCALNSAVSETPAVALYFDLATRSLLDRRVRWCRCYLDMCGLPYDREMIVTDESLEQWAYLSEASEDLMGSEPQDPLDLLSMWNFAFSGPGYAAKFLAHFRRAERILDQPHLTQGEALSLARECMLIGETWAEAKFVINNAKAALSGHAQRKAGERGRAMRTDASFATTHGREAQAMANDIATRNPKLSWEAIKRRLATHFNVSEGTIKNSVSNPKKDG